MKSKIIIVLTGEIGSGKTTLATSLKSQYNFEVLKTSDVLIKYSESSKFRQKKDEDKRMFLQRIGEQLDKETRGNWILTHFQSIINKKDRIIIDSVRIPEQIEAIRQSYGYQNVIQIHLHVSERELERRHFKRNNLDFHDLIAIQNYQTYKHNVTESKVKDLENDADLIIDTEKAQIEDIVIRVASYLRLLPSIHSNFVDVLVGGQFGSEGKGQIAAYIAPEYDCLVRVGGPNAGHKVYEDSGADTFHILPSGTRRSPNSIIVLGAATVIDLKVLLEEIQKFDIQPERLIVDENCTIISDKDKSLESGLDKIGSTKQGVGAATANNLLVNRLNMDLSYKAKNCAHLKSYIGSAHSIFEKLYSENKKILLEGTQGSLLSLHHGIYPFVTSRDTNVSGCISDAGISPKRIRKIIMVTRTYPIRVQNPKDGTSGPFSRNETDYEISFDELSKRSNLPLETIIKIEKTSTTKKQRRIAEFNWALFREACELNSPTDIALTFSDYIDASNQKARRYDQLTTKTTKFIDEIERCAGIPVSLIATGFNHRSIIDRRNWI
ncbi:MAG: adenylosuccinate synthetase [Tenuifilaceae bacterium]